MVSSLETVVCRPSARRLTATRWSPAVSPRLLMTTLIWSPGVRLLIGSKNDSLSVDVVTKRTVNRHGFQPRRKINLQLNVRRGLRTLVDDANAVAGVAADFNWIDHIINIKKHVDEMFNRECLFGVGFYFENEANDSNLIGWFPTSTGIVFNSTCASTPRANSARLQ